MCLKQKIIWTKLIRPIHFVFKNIVHVHDFACLAFASDQNHIAKI